ncbi:MAG: SDR family oxidoreductase [Candidatus Dadabacteria bacterium]|nr:MAG: SDR family oxidoreductase [Candidatus Dadabacteria bacterium]
MLLSNRVAVVSGIGPGLGLAVAQALAREGADTLLVGRTPQRLEQAASQLRAHGRRALWQAADITAAADCRRVAETVGREFGRLDILVNNAYHPGTYEPFESADLATWRPPLEVNLLGTMQVTQALLDLLKQSEDPSVVMINSMVIRRPLATFGGYAASKAALMAATQTLALELGKYKIRVNSVVPGYIWGPQLKEFFAKQAERAGTTIEAIYQATARETALEHLPTPEEIAEAVVFFASSRSRAITGQSLDVNGGHCFW